MSQTTPPKFWPFGRKDSPTLSPADSSSSVTTNNSGSKPASFNSKLSDMFGVTNGEDQMTQQQHLQHPKKVMPVLSIAKPLSPERTAHISSSSNNVGDSSSSSVAAPQQQQQPVRRGMFDMFKSKATAAATPVAAYYHPQQAVATATVQRPTVDTSTAATSSNVASPAALGRAKSIASPPVNTVAKAPDAIRIELFSASNQHGAVLTAEHSNTAARTASGNASTGVYKFFRSSATTKSFDEIQSSSRPTYTTTIDDLNATIYCQYQPTALQGSVMSNFAEFGPIECQSEVQKALNEMRKSAQTNVTVRKVGARSAASATAENATDATAKPLAVDATSYILQIDSDTNAMQLISLKPDEPTITYAISASLQFTVDSVDSKAFILSVDRVNQHGTRSSTQTQHLCVDDSKVRDALGLLIRGLVDKTAADGKSASAAAVTAAPAPIKVASSVTDIVTISITPSASGDGIAINVQPIASNPTQVPASTATLPTPAVREALQVVQPAASVQLQAHAIPLPATPAPSPSPEPSPPSNNVSQPVDNPLQPTAETASDVTIKPLANDTTADSRALLRQISDVEAEKQVLIEQRNDLIERITNAESKWKSQHSEWQASLKAAKQETTTARQQLQQTIDERNSAWNDVSELRQALKQMSENLGNHANAEIQFAKELRELREQRSASQVDAMAARSELQRVRQQLAESEKRFHDREDEMSQLRGDAMKLSDENKRHTDKQQQHDALVQKSQAETKAAQKQLQQTTEQTKLQLNKARDDLSKMSKLVQRVDQLEMENYQLQRQLEQQLSNGGLTNQAAQESKPSAEAPESPSAPINIVIEVAQAPAPSSQPTKPSHTRQSSKPGDDPFSSTTYSPQHSPQPPMHPHGRTDSKSNNLSHRPAYASSSVQDLITALKTVSPDTVMLNKQEYEQYNDKLQMLTQLQATYNQLDQQHQRVVKQLQQLEATHNTTVKQHTDETGTVTTLQSQVQALQSKLEQAENNRNYFKKKAESLSSTVERMLKERQRQDSLTTPTSAQHSRNSSTGSAHSPNNNAESFNTSLAHERHLQQQVQHWKRQHKDANTMLEYYKRTFEEQHSKVRQLEQELSMVQRNSAYRGGLSSLVNAVGGSGSVPTQQFEQIRQLANSLSEQTADQQKQVHHLKGQLAISTSRMQQLEDRFRVELSMGDESSSSPALSRVGSHASDVGSVAAVP